MTADPSSSSLGYLRIDLTESVPSYVLADPAIPGEINVGPTDLQATAGHVSPVCGVIDPVRRDRPCGAAVGIVKAAPAGDAIEEFLVRDAVDLIWEILRLRRVKAGVMNASMQVRPIS